MRKESVNKEIADADVKERFKEIEKNVLPFLYNLSKSNEPIYTLNQIEDSSSAGTSDVSNQPG